MKIIDLLNKIANGEEVPKKIYCFDREFYLKANTYFGDTFTLMHYIQEEDLNNEVEILEEKKEIPEKLEYYDDSIAWVIDNVGQLSDVDKVIIDKLNGVIDYLKSKGDE